MDASTHLPSDPLPAGVHDLEFERDALRVQAAAVSAQHVSLTEFEIRLDQRATALERQREQLAAHLEERRQRLLDLREQLRIERDQCHSECEAMREEAGDLHTEGRQALQEARAVRDQAKRETKRLVELRRRLKRRWKKHWSIRERETAALQQQLEQQKATLTREREHLTQARLRHNGEMELGRCRLREEFQELALAQQHWEETVNHESAERHRQGRLLAEQALTLEAAERQLAEQQREWGNTLDRLRREADGLEERIRNRRRELPVLPAPIMPTIPLGEIPAIGHLGTPVSDVVVGDTTFSLSELENLAGDIDDQRRHLLEQWQRLAEVQEQWQRQRDTLQRELEHTAEDLQEREQHIAQREATVRREESVLHDQRTTLQRQALGLQGAQTRLTAQAANAQAERDGLNAELAAAQRQLAVRSAHLEQVHHLRGRRRREERAGWLAWYGKLEQAEQLYLRQIEEVRQRRATLDEELSAFTARRLAFEEIRRDFLDRADDVRIDRRIEKLERQHAEHLTGSVEELDALHDRILDVAQRQEQEAERLTQEEVRLLQQRDELQRLQQDLEIQRIHYRAEEAQRAEEVRLLEARRDIDLRHLAELREEVDRLGRYFLEESETPIARAA
jgi:hypothetical protein